jgi:hypothetical protein
LLLIIAGYFVRAAAIFVPRPRNIRFRIADFPRFSPLCVQTMDLNADRGELVDRGSGVGGG